MKVKIQPQDNEEEAMLLHLTGPDVPKNLLETHEHLQNKQLCLQLSQH